MNQTRIYLEQTLSRFTGFLQENVFAEEAAGRSGWLQEMDPRAKLAGFLLIISACSFSHSIITIVSLLIFSFILAAGSNVASLSFLKRVWIFMPLYTSLIAIPALFLTPGEPAGVLPVLNWTITEQGLSSASFLVMRVATSVSFMMLIVLTTRWPVLLKAFRSLGMPHLLVFLLAMTYRYIYVLLQTSNSLYLARKSRRVGPEAWRNSREWLGAISGSLLGKSYSLSSEIYLAMVSRGFRGEPQLLSEFRMKRRDWLWMLLFVFTSLAAIFPRIHK